jgi:predicted N-acetyltransferase YhbS
MENKKDYITRPYQFGDEEQIVQLFKLVFKDWPKHDIQGTAADHWRWKFLDLPDKHNRIIVAEHDGKIIGISSGLSLKIKIGEKTFIGQKGADAAVHPDYRGMGVFSSIDKIKHKMLADIGYNISYSVTSNPILIERSKRRNIERPFPHPIIYLVRIQDIDKHLKYYEYDRADTVLKYGYIGAKILSRLEPKKTIKKLSEFEVNEVTSFGLEINKFWEQLKTGYDFIVEKTMEYLNWRYCDPRGGFYKILLARDDDRVIGYIVYKVNRFREEYPRGNIMETLALPDRGDVIEALIKEVVARFDLMDVNIVHAQIIKGHPYAAMLKRHGFVDSRVKPYLTYRPVALGEELDRFVNASPTRLNYQYGESDRA